MVRRARILEGLIVVVALFAAGCSKKAPQKPAIEEIAQSEPNQRARALRDEVTRLFKAGKLDEAAEKAEPLTKAVADILSAMEVLHHKKTAVPDFAVVRYVEALRDLGENLRGFGQLYSRKNPAPLKREMLQGLIEQLQQKIR
jgi:hypothetical protein